MAANFAQNLISIQNELLLFAYKLTSDQKRQTTSCRRLL